MLIALNDDSSNFHETFADEVVDHLNFLYRTPIEIYDASTQAKRRILIRLNGHIIYIGN